MKMKLQTLTQTFLYSTLFFAVACGVDGNFLKNETHSQNENEDESVLDRVPSLSPSPKWNGSWKWVSSLSSPDCPDQIRPSNMTSYSRVEVTEDCKQSADLDVLEEAGFEILKYECKIGDNLFAAELDFQMTSRDNPRCVGKGSFDYFLEINEKNADEITGAMVGELKITDACLAEGQKGPTECHISAAVKGTRVENIPDENFNTTEPIPTSSLRILKRTLLEDRQPEKP